MCTYAVINSSYSCQSLRDFPNKIIVPSPSGHYLAGPVGLFLLEWQAKKKGKKRKKKKKKKKEKKKVKDSKQREK